MKLEDIVFYELELTSKCNARCPGCSRTLDGDTHPGLEMLDISIDQIKKIFPPKAIKGKDFGFSGVYGDPGMNKDLYEICEYFLENECRPIVIDTNGGMQTENFWYKLSQLSLKYDWKLCVKFNVDGYKDTNHLYRVNVNWDKLTKNMEAYSKGQGRGVWQYIEFDHNIDDIDLARQHAKSLGFEFRVRRSARNQSKKSWIAVSKKKEDGKIVEHEHSVTATNNAILHKHAQAKYNITKNIDSITNTKFTDVSCRLIHEKRAYISHDMRLWPCCWFGDMHKDNARASSIQKGREKLFVMEDKFGKDWNNLNKHSIDQILEHDYYAKILEESWNTEHELYIKRCIIECGGHGSRSKIEYEIKDHADISKVKSKPNAKEVYTSYLKYQKESAKK